MTTLQELFAKVQAGTATATDFEQISKLSKAQAEEHKKVETTAKDLIESIKKANIAPQLLTNLLAQEGLIIVPKAKEKLNIFESGKIKFEGNERETTFKVWAGRDFDSETKDVQEKWKVVKAKGKDYFISHLTTEGKTYYETDEGKAYINKLFA
ncbi:MULTISPECIES: hypothetical protein [Burkholderia cepacia complex]|uniref:hypothetical protein n=1 Tax=Burkholderia cepacia complex TaxID=87882 RepID=UPI00097C3E46|nr:MULTISPECIES: hypothetical protein [Burkholderia cepacia complex]ONJ06135.1 hypothetical protein A8F53_05710 [Burkholderia cenocepacia]OOA08148.1 hypothetical protein A8F55_27950 [Burkholderia cenocepacia]OOA14553.1 hypothetical protein A8F56_28595 [Burkholderia cenocepacia]OOA18452.1 hypothetical protein A8F58_30480 [Burkholderia cenocepacia]OOA44098.1 hypothetical protein A8F57_14110 [Burkholderia cenocepacia]